MTPQGSHIEHRARERYARNLFRAQITDLFGLITGENTDLLRYDEVAKQLKARQQVAQSIQNVPLNQIIGSVGRYRDFTRTFLPRARISQGRWAKVDSAMNSLEGVPPVELFKIGEAYFVRDGNHRISVARANGLSDIEAYVTEIQTPVPLTIDDFDRDQWLIKAEYADFLAQTGLAQSRPNHDLRLTEPGRYSILLHHIEVHRYLKNSERTHKHAMSWKEAVASWYDTVYMPVVDAIRTHEQLQQFPNRTEADLYLWIAYHREALVQQYELAPLSPEMAVTTFAQTHSERPLESAMQNMREGLRRVLWRSQLPPGMSQQEFDEARARHDAGEISVGEAAKTT